MEWKIGDITIPNQVVVAPMAGVTNVAFRMICKEFGAGMVVCEMISDKGIHFRNKKTLEMLFVDPSEHPASVQIFGGSKETLVEAAQFVAENTNTDIIDIIWAVLCLRSLRPMLGQDGCLTLIKYMRWSKQFRQQLKNQLP